MEILMVSSSLGTEIWNLLYHRFLYIYWYFWFYRFIKKNILF